MNAATLKEQNYITNEGIRMFLKYAIIIMFYFDTAMQMHQMEIQ